MELDRWYEEPPAGQNAAVLYLMGFTAMHISHEDYESTNRPIIGTAKLPDVEKPLPVEMKTAIAELTDNNRGAVRFFVQAAKHEQSRYPIDLTQGQMTMLPHLSKIKSAAQLLELFALSQAVTNDAALAGKGILTGLALAQSLDSEPVLISQLVRVACVHIAVNGLEQVLNRVVLPPEFLNRLQKVLQSCEKREALGVGFTRAWVGERVTGLSTFDMSPEDYLKVPDTATPAEREKLTLEIKAILAADKQLFESTFAKVSAIRREPFPLRLNQSDIFLQAVNQATNRQLLLSCMLLPGLGNVSWKEAGCLAWLRLAQTAVALEQFRTANDDHYPKSLRELTPSFLNAIPADPFDGQSLRYRKEGNGYVLYSIGKDIKDDNGKRLKQQDGDLVFSVINPPKSKP
ncbi:MAG: hypothetical protein HOP33_19765 [Verrucomicrobia bacterium]|nr:hypothetical protein [Verrucomicrobiota bacterium]